MPTHPAGELQPGQIVTFRAPLTAVVDSVASENTLVRILLLIHLLPNEPVEVVE